MLLDRWPLRAGIARLEKYYGHPPRLPVSDPFDLVLWECCAYLVDDVRRAAVYARLLKATRADPERIAALPPSALAMLIAADGGMQPDRRAEKLQHAANLVLEWGQAELRSLCRTDPAAARKLLKQLPGIGEPGADRILMIAGSVKTLAPDSNGARVLCRLGFGKDSARYDRMYRSVIQETMPELPDTPSWWLRAHQLLRQHGQSLCRRNAPRCRECPLAPRCPSAR